MCMHTYVFVNLATPGDNHACTHHPLQVGVWPCEAEPPLPLFLISLPGQTEVSTSPKGIDVVTH